MKHSMGSNKLPKSMRKKRIHEIHPILRRSVCTLIVALIVVSTGVVVILIDLLVLGFPISIRGLLALLTGLLLMVIGIIWFVSSRKKLQAMKERAEQARQKKIKSHQSNSFDVVETVFMPVALPKHALQWPARMNCTGDNCRETTTSPNGNHLQELYHFCSETDDENCQSQRLLISSLLPRNNLKSDTVSSRGSQECLQSKDNYPIRIGKNGHSVNVLSIEQCKSCAIYDKSEEDLKEKSLRMTISSC